VQGRVLTSSNTPRDPFCDPLVEILDASVTPSVVSNQYGVVSDGFIRIKGPLLQPERITVDKSVVRWSEELTTKDFPDLWENNSKISIHWDNEGFTYIVQVAKPFFIPFKIAKDFWGKGLVLEGIILSPTLLQKGQYQRIGWFQINENPALHNKRLPSETSSIHEPSVKRIQIESYNHRSTSDGSLSPDCGLAKDVPAIDGYPQSHPSPGNAFPYRSVLDLMTIFHTRLKRVEDSLPNLPDFYPYSRRFDGPRQPGNANLAPSDKYCNGFIDTTLVERYEGQLDVALYPHINSCLSLAAVQSDYCQYEEWQEYYEEPHGQVVK
jgi:hypothetical protein